MSLKKNPRVAELECAIKRHQDLYYNGQPEISDADFDALWDELKALDPVNPILAKVGADALDGWPKAKPLIPLTAQARAFYELEKLWFQAPATPVGAPAPDAAQH